MSKLKVKVFIVESVRRLLIRNPSDTLDYIFFLFNSEFETKFLWRPWESTPRH